MNQSRHESLMCVHMNAGVVVHISTQLFLCVHMNASVVVHVSAELLTCVCMYIDLYISQ